MQAKETKFQDILEGTKQFIVPLFQRTYDWGIQEWNTLWSDLNELYERDKPRPHFLGSIVCLPAKSVPEGVTKYSLIDGQQRLTTIFILLALLRNKANDAGNQKFSEEINNTLIVNPYKKNLDFYKLLPTQADRQCYFDLINEKPLEAESKISKAYYYFEKKLDIHKLDHEKLKEIIINYLSIVSIVLDEYDNPYLVFESLNSKGRRLTPADLIRNYFFMWIHIDKQEEIYNLIWLPMQNSLKDELTDFIRHFLMRKGSFVRQSDVYYFLKEEVKAENAISNAANKL